LKRKELKRKELKRKELKRNRGYAELHEVKEERIEDP